MNIVQYFSDNIFNESLILVFKYKTEDNTVEMVCDYANDVVLSIYQGYKPPLLLLNGTIYHRDFRKLTFIGVDKYERSIDSKKELAKCADEYIAKDHVRSVVVQDMQVSYAPSSDVFGARINFGDFGWCRFNFIGLQIERRLARSIGKQGDSEEWNYVDVYSMQPVDFYNPFD